MKIPYIILRDNEEKEFNSTVLFEIAQQVKEKISAFVEVIEDLRNPHAKHLVRIVEQALRFKSKENFKLNFDKDKAEFAAYYEKELQPSSSQNIITDDALVQLMHFFKSESHINTGKSPQDIFICDMLHKLIQKYHTTILDPEAFHRYKIEWFNIFINKVPNDTNVPMENFA